MPPLHVGARRRSAPDRVTFRFRRVLGDSAFVTYRPSPGRPLMPLASFRRRFAYHAWATRSLADAVTEADPHAEARRFLGHAVTADRVWLLRLQGEPTTGIALWPALDAAALRALAEANADAYAAYLGALTEAGLDTPIVYANSKGVRYETALRDVLDHVLLHGAYHRGQTARALRQAGDAPPWTDFIVWVRAGGELGLWSAE